MDMEKPQSVHEIKEELERLKQIETTSNMSSDPGWAKEMAEEIEKLEAELTARAPKPAPYYPLENIPSETSDNSPASKHKKQSEALKKIGDSLNN